jgi:hypothetical protein
MHKMHKQRGYVDDVLICYMIFLKYDPFWHQIESMKIMFNWRTTQLGWRSKALLMSWIIISHPPLVATPNWCGEKCVAKASRNWRHKMQLMNWYDFSPPTMGRIPHEGLVMVKKQNTPRICVIQCGIWPCVIWKQSWNNCGNPFTKSYRWN